MQKKTKYLSFEKLKLWIFESDTKLFAKIFDTDLKESFNITTHFHEMQKVPKVL
jgi:hypothetical protein